MRRDCAARCDSVMIEMPGTAATAEAALAKRRKERREKAGFKIGDSVSLGQQDDEVSGERSFTGIPRSGIGRNRNVATANHGIRQQYRTNAHAEACLRHEMGNTIYKQGAWRKSQSWLTLTPKRPRNKQKGVTEAIWGAIFRSAGNQRQPAPGGPASQRPGLPGVIAPPSLSSLRWRRNSVTDA